MYLVRGVCLAQGMYLVQGGVPGPGVVPGPGGVYLVPGGYTCPGTPPVNRMTDRCKILPCPKLRLRAVMNQRCH